MRPVPDPRRSALRFAVKLPVICASADVIASLLVIAVILHTGCESQLSESEIVMLTGTIDYLSGTPASGKVVHDPRVFEAHGTAIRGWRKDETDNSRPDSLVWLRHNDPKRLSYGVIDEGGRDRSKHSQHPITDCAGNLPASRSHSERCVLPSPFPALPRPSTCCQYRAVCSSK